MTKPIRSNAENEQLLQTVQMFELITESQPNDIQSLEILKEAYLNLGRDTDAVAISKKIARVYVSLGQLSSAILEYEGILQKFPEDAECLAALDELESKMAGLAVHGVGTKDDQKAAQTFKDAEQFEDGNEALVKFFEEYQLLSKKDADNVLSMIISMLEQALPGKLAPSLIALMEDCNLVPTEKSLALLAEKTQLPYLPMALYDVDSNKAALLDKEFCLRHLILPFDQISKTVFVATANPFDAQAKNRVEAEIQGRIQWYLTTPQDLIKQLRDIFHIL